VGALFLRGKILEAIPMDLNNAWRVVWLMVPIIYLLTIVLEFPFVALAFYRDPSWWRKSIRGSLVIQTASYALLFGWYWLASGTTLYTGNRVVELSSMSLPEQVVMYYIGEDDGDVYRRSLAGPAAEKVFDLDPTQTADRLLVRPSSADSTMWDLVLAPEGGSRWNTRMIREAFAAVAAPEPRSMDTDPPQYDGTWFNFGEVPKLREARSSPWDLRTGFWAVEGLKGRREDTGARAGFAFRTPFRRWHVRNATHLPKDKVLLQLGKD
jgi:hypothetical protein